jgi:hypothetical protein
MANTDLRVVDRNPVMVAQVKVPSQAQADLDAAVLDIRECLDRAWGADAPGAIVEALDCLLPRVLVRTRPRPSDAQLRLILDAKNKARWPIRDFLNAHLADEDISRGLDAFLALVIHWNEADAISAARCPDVVPDLRDYAEDSETNSGTWRSWPPSRAAANGGSMTPSASFTRPLALKEPPDGRRRDRG